MASALLVGMYVPRPGLQVDELHNAPTSNCECIISMEASRYNGQCVEQRIGGNEGESQWQGVI
jgi:hypothetical protein